MAESWDEACAGPCYCASITMASKKPVCLLVRTSIRSIPPSRDMTKLLITLPWAARTVHVHLCTSLLVLVPLHLNQKSKCAWKISQASIDRWVCKSCSQVSLNSKLPLIAKLCFRYASSFFVTVIRVGGGDKKGLETVSQQQVQIFVLQSYFHIEPPVIICFVAERNNLARVRHKRVCTSTPVIICQIQGLMLVWVYRSQLPCNQMGVDTIRYNGSIRGRRAYKGAGGSVQSPREYTRWECTITYIHQQFMLDESGYFGINLGRILLIHFVRMSDESQNQWDVVKNLRE